jgi:NADPH:quinone reductase-like Zn-dependent oxidoreductase
MKAIQAHPQQGLNGLTLVDLPDPGDPGPDAIRVRVHATSLNFHDLGVVTGRLPAADGRTPWPMAPGWWRQSVRRSLGSSPATT